MDHLPAQEAKHVINLLSGLFLYAYRTKNKKAKVTMDNIAGVSFHNTSSFILSCRKRTLPVLQGFKAVVSSSCML